MTTAVKIAPVRKSIRVNVNADRAFCFSIIQSALAGAKASAFIEVAKKTLKSPE